MTKLLVSVTISRRPRTGARGRGPCEGIGWTRRALIVTLMAAAVLAGLGCGGEGAGTSEAEKDATTTSTTTPGSSICDDAPAFGHLDWEAAGGLPYWGEDMTPITLGPDGAREMLPDLANISPSFCDAAVSPEVRAALEEAATLAGRGDEAGARTLLETLLTNIGGSLDISSGAAATPTLAAMDGRSTPAPIHLVATPALAARNPVLVASDALARKAAVMTAVREYLEVAARMQVLGIPPETFPKDPLQQAAETFDEWARQAVEESTDIRELLEIGAGADLLGGDPRVVDRALERAGELAKAQALALAESFRPCSAERPEATAFFVAMAKWAALGGAQEEMADGMYDLSMWMEIQKLRAEGKPVPQCEIWTLTATYTKTGGRNSMDYTWQGEFSVGDDGSVEGSGTGSVKARGEGDFNGTWTVDIVGTIDFSIEGKQVGAGEAAVFELTLPGTVDYTATYNPPSGPEARVAAAEMLLLVAEVPHMAGPWSPGVDYVNVFPSLPVPVKPGTATFQAPSVGGTLTVTISSKE